MWFLKVDILKVLFHHHPILRQKQPTIDWWWRRPKGEKRCSLLWRLNTREPYQEREHFALGFFSTVSPRKLRSILAENVALFFLRLFSGFQTQWILILLYMYFNLQLDYTRKNFFYCRKRHKKSRLYKSFLFGSWFGPFPFHSSILKPNFDLSFG